MKTSEDAWEEYQKLKLIEEKAKKLNRGGTLLNPNVERKQYFIKLLNEKIPNILKTKERILVDNNLPITSYYNMYWRDDNERGTDNFLEELEKWARKPKYEFLTKFNRKSENKPYMSSDYFRKETILPEDVTITIGKEANKKIDVKKFKSEVARILKLQRNPTQKENVDYERFWFLLNELEALKNRTKERYGYYDTKDRTLKIRLGKKEYNQKLKSMSDEFEQLEKKYPFLQKPSIYIEEPKKKPTFEEFKDDSEEDLEEAWYELGEEETKEYNEDYDKFCEAKYDEFLETNDFDE